MEQQSSYLQFISDAQKELWDQYAMQASDGGLLQSFAWGEFHKSLGNQVFRIVDRYKVWAAQCIKLKAGGQWILQIPRGPVGLSGKDIDDATLSTYLKEMKKFAQEHECFLLRIDPAWNPQSHHVDFMKRVLWVHKSGRERNPTHSLVVDISQSEKTLLEGMKSKWRYNIRLAQKKGVEVYWDTTEEGAEIFASLMAKTTKRKEFASYDAEYFKKLVKHVGAFCFAKVGSNTVAGVFIAFFGDHAYYLHGASLYDYRSYMAPHALQWEAMMEAKRRGVKHYDFWGVAANPPANEQEKHLVDVTRFKAGFAKNVELTPYAGNYEIAASKLMYGAYWLRQVFK